MLGKILLNSFLLLATVALQKGFIASLPHFLNGTNLILISIVFILGIYGFWTAFYWTIGIGAILDIYSFVFFGNYLLNFMLVLFLANFLFAYLFTNKSLYSFLMIVFFGSIFFEISFTLFYYLEILLRKGDFDIVFDSDLIILKTFGILSNLIISLIIFNVLNFLSNKLKPVFLFKN